MSLNDQIKDVIDSHPVLTGIGLTIGFWLLVYHLGNATGETIANILNKS